MTTILPHCPDCGAPQSAGETCEAHFHQLLFWEAEHPDYAAQLHHLMVLCYHLQHPGLYSPEGLIEARRLLVDFLDGGLSPQTVRQRNRARVDSGARTWTITARAGARGAYHSPVAWPMTIADVVAGGVEAYCDNVRTWAQSIHAALAAADRQTAA
jgi:hypothetical protein